MKIPDKIILFCEEYKIVKINANQMKKIDPYSETLSEGLLDKDKKIIYIRIDAESNVEEIFWHEMGHYFAYITESQDNEAFAQSFSILINNIYKQII